MFTEKMRKLEIVMLRQDANRVLEYLGKHGCLQLTDLEPHQDEEAARPYHDELRKLEAAASYLGISRSAAVPPDTRLPEEADVLDAENLVRPIRELMEREEELRAQRLSLLHARDEIAAFSRLAVPFRELEHLTFLVFRTGTVEPGRLDELREALAQRAVVIPLDDRGRILVAASRKGRWALDTELKRADFREAEFPEDTGEVPAELVAGLESEIRRVEGELEGIGRRKNLYRSENGLRIESLFASFTIGSSVEEVRDELKHTREVFRVSGWIPQADLGGTVDDLSRLTGDRIAVNAWRPNEVETVRQGKEQVPVRLRHSRFVGAFQNLVFSYGAPLYGTIDPTPFVAFMFILLFAIMFGDVGQGLVGLLFGLLLHSGRVRQFRKWRKFGSIFIAVGAASMVTGFLYGSVFSSEELLVPLNRRMSAFLFGEPMDRFVTIMPSEGIEKLFAFFLFTLGVGVIINSVGLVINIYNRFILGRYGEALFAKTGVAGAFFFWYAVYLAVRIMNGGTFLLVDAVLLIIPLALIFWSSPLERLLSGRRPLFHEGALTFFMEGFVEILESISYYLSNSISFLRVAAFALAHVVLSIIIFRMAELIGEAPGGVFFQALILIIGNALIILLEGLIVTIQVVRLHYYEFFSKFFTESGVEFRPFTFMFEE